MLNTILKPFATALGFIMDLLYRFMGIFGLTNIGLTIIIFTLIINILMIPLTVRQLKFSKLNALINPEIKAIQKKVGATADGDWGTNTSKAMQKFLGVTVDGEAGPETYKAFQKWINKELGF